MFREGMDYHQQCSVLGLAQGHPTLFDFAVFVIEYCQLQRIQKYIGGLLEAYSMLFGVGFGLARIPLKIISHAQLSAGRFREAKHDIPLVAHPVSGFTSFSLTREWSVSASFVWKCVPVLDSS
jgi:hypothetical protein